MKINLIPWAGRGMAGLLVGLTSQLQSAAASATAVDLLRQGVVAEETGSDPQRSLSLYREAVAAGEAQRVATATALFRLGELEWRQGKTNDATRTWRLLSGQYPDQTNLLVLVRDRVPGTPVLTLTPPLAASPGLTALERAAANIDELELLPPNELAIWLRLHDIPAPELAEVIKARSQLRLEFEERRQDSNPARLKEIDQALRRFAEKIETERENLLKILRLEAKRLGSTQASVSTSPSGSSSKTADGPKLPDISPEEQAELARVQRLLKESPDLITTPPGKDQLPPLENAAFNGYQRVIDLLQTNQFDIKGSRALHVAVAGGRNAMVQRLIAAGVDVNRPDAIATPLMYAVVHGHRSVVQTLVKAGATVNAPGWNPSGNQFLTSSGSIPRVQSFSGESEVNRQLDGRPIHAAVVLKDLPLLELLLGAGADPNSTNSKGVTLLHSAVSRNHLEMTSLLVQKGADPNRLADGASPLCVSQGIKMTKLLLDAKADPNRFDKSENAPITRATFDSGSSALQQMIALIEQGARVDLNLTGNNPDLLHVALASKKNDRNQRCEILLKAGARYTPVKGNRLLHAAVSINDPELVALALKYGEKADEASDREPPLWWSVEKNNSKIVEQLLEAGADPNKSISGNATPGATATIFSSAKRIRPYPAGGVFPPVTTVTAKIPSLPQPPPTVFSISPSGTVPRPGVVPGVHLEVNGPESAEAERLKILALLEAKGGREFFSHSNALLFGTALTNNLSWICTRTDVNGPREYTLSVVLENLLTRPLEPGGERQAVFPWYPNLARAEIYNDVNHSQPARRQPVNLQALIESGDFGKSQRLEWGDILIVPTTIPNSELEPYVLPKAQLEALRKTNQRTITVRFGDRTERVVLGDGFGFFDRQRQRSEQSRQGFESGSDIQAIIRSVGKPPNGAPPKVALKFQTRFRISRRAEPGPMEGVHSFFDPGWINITQSSTGYSFQPTDQRGNYLNRQEIRREDCLGELFHFQDGDEVTLYPLPAP